MNAVEWVIHKMMFGVVFASLLLGGTFVVLYGPKDNQLVQWLWIGVYAIIVYYGTYILAKIFFMGGSRINP